MRGSARGSAAQPANPRLTALLVSCLVAAMLAACTTGAAPSASTAPAATGTPSSERPPVAVPELQNIELDGGRADLVTIGPEGGELEVTDASGVAYWLQVPEGAVAQPTAMGAVPITKLAQQPDRTRLVAGIHFLPDGQRFSKTATLTVTLPVPASGPVVTVAYGGDFAEPHRYPATVDGKVIKFDVVHFSGYALLAATDEAASAAQLGLLVPQVTPTSPADQMLAEVAAAFDLSGDERNGAVNHALDTWIASLETMVGQFRGFATYDLSGQFDVLQVELAEALHAWAYLQKLFVIVGVLPGIPQFDRIMSLATTAASHAIAVINTDCNASPSEVLLRFRVPLLAAWHALATEVGIQARDPSFAAEFLTEHACVQVEFNPEGGTDFPSGVRPGDSGTLSLDIGIRIDGSHTRFGVGPFNLDIRSEDTEPPLAEAQPTDGQGHSSWTVLWDPASPELRIDVKACLPSLPDVCQLASIIRGTVATPPPATGCPSFTAGSVAGHSWSTVSTSNAQGSAAIGGDMVVSFGLTGGAASVRGTGTWSVDAASAPPGPQSVRVVWEGEMFWRGSAPGSGGTANVTMTVNGASATSSVAAPGSMTPAKIHLEQPLSVSNGDIVTITFSSGVSNGDAKVGLSMSGSLDFVTPENVSIIQTECVAPG